VLALVDTLASAYALRVVTLKPSYPDPRHYPPSSMAEVDARAPYRIQRLFTFCVHRKSPVVRAIREQLMAVALVLLSAGPADIIFTSSPSMFLGPAAWARARLAHGLFVWDLRDITWEYARESLESNGPGVRGVRRFFLACLKAYMIFVVKRTDLVLTANEALAEAVVRMGVPRNRVLAIEASRSEALADLLEDGTNGASNRRPCVTYVGLIGDAQGRTLSSWGTGRSGKNSNDARATRG
jgi:hypothetical protein